MATSALQLKADEIRAKRVDWDQYKQGQLLSSEDYLIIVQLDSTASQQRDVLLKERPNECARALMNIIGKLAKEETLYYSLTLIDDILEEDLNRTKIFFQYAQTTKETAWKPFMGLLNRDGFISNQASHILAKLASFSGETLEEKDLKYLINWLKEHLVDKKNEYIETTIHCLQVMLRVKPYRDVFFELDGVDAILSRLNTPKIGFQLQYQLIYCFWVLTFDADGVERISKKNIIPTLSDTLSDSNKEKVHRIIFATFKNLLELASEVETRRCNSLAMVQCRVQRELQRVDVRKWIDEDLNADLLYLTDALALCVQDFSSFDEYSAEVRSGRLEWSPAHRSEKFWRDNVTRLNEKDFEILKMLVKLLEVSNDPLVLSVAAHDVGQYVRLYPRGKKILETLGGKQRVMILLAHTDPNVRYEALLAVQKIMVHNWEYLGKQLQALDSQPKEKTQL